MPRIIIVAAIDDATNRDEGLGTQGELFKRQSVTTCHYTVTDDEAAVCFEADDLDPFTP